MKQADRMEKNKADFLKHLEANHGNVKRAGAAIGIKWPHNWIARHTENDPEFAKRLEEVREEIRNQLVDSAEDLLFEKVFIKKETAAIFFFLKCQAKDRGWLEAKEFRGTGKPITIKIERVISDGNAEERIYIENENALKPEGNLQ